MGFGLPAAAQEIKELNFGIIATESSSAQQRSFGPVLEAMSKAVGIPVKPFFAQDYAGVIEGMRFNKVDLAWHGGLSAMGAVDRAGGEVIAQVVKQDGKSGYYSYLVARSDRQDLSSEKDVLDCSKGLNFGTGDVNSTSAYLIPNYYLFASNKIDVRSCFKRTLSATHESNLMAVINKQLDAAVVSSGSLERLRDTKPEEADKIKVLWRSPLIPGDPIVWRSNLPAELKAKIYTFFFSYGRLGTIEEIQADRKALGGIRDGWGPFAPSSNLQLVPIRQLDLFSNKMKIEANADLSAAEKSERVADIDAKLAELERIAKELPAR